MLLENRSMNVSILLIISYLIVQVRQQVLLQLQLLPLQQLQLQRKRQHLSQKPKEQQLQVLDLTKRIIEFEITFFNVYMTKFMLRL